MLQTVSSHLKSCIFKKLSFSWKSPYFRVSYHLKLIAFSRNERTHPHFVCRREKSRFFCEDCSLAAPYVFSGALGLIFVSTGQVIFARFSLNCIRQSVDSGPRVAYLARMRDEVLLLDDCSRTRLRIASALRWLTLGTAIFHWLYFGGNKAKVKIESMEEYFKLDL